MQCEISIDYGLPDIWERLAVCVEQRFEARASQAYGYVVCDPNWSWKPRLSDYDLWFAVAGRGTVCLGGQEYPIEPGTLLFMRPGDRGWATQDTDNQLTVIYIHFDWYVPGKAERTEVEARWLPSRYVRYEHATHITMLLGRVVRLLGRRQPLARLEAKFVLQQALLDIYQQDAINQGVTTARIDPRLERVMAQVRSQPEARHTLEEVARLAELSPPYFSQVFKREFGVSFRTFVVQARLERANYLLTETNYPIGHIAELLGYTDIFLFSRQFKRYFGCSPTHLRRP